MIRSMYSGIAGLKNFQTKLDVIGNNIANVNTYGFKKGRVTFKEAMTQTIQGASAAQEGRGGTNPLQIGLGSTTATIDSVQTQASLQTTGRSLDLSINGDGFFVVQGPGGQNFYTRGGNFYLDQGGQMVTGEGYRVQQFQNGVVNDVVINSGAVMPAQQTENITFSGNLSSSVSYSADNPYTYTQQMKIVDDAGEEHVFQIEMSPGGGGTNAWNVTATNFAIDDEDGTVENQSTGVITFNAEGVAEWTTPLNSLRIIQGGAPMDYFGAGTPNLQGLTNNVGEVTAMIGADGNIDGSLESFNIGAAGEINGVYSNGQITPLGTLGLARFNNPSGLVKVGNNLFQESVNSGVANIGTAAAGGGSISAGTLEMSNVDLSEEFTEMITAQRGFQANTRIITTSDQILEELVNLKR
ncbi:flagellar hook protein FlgE [Jeotgalibacillus soli]|uniref:Flagellar hook protein FlgE n=1 Tax=Jeotgalibacillus soli TaxID=889306 RepID=A0A0C2V7F7_9BACL|nr:flagellar hook protein FlgE [Jeotgalibacillus soli]KIL44892.1 flagellar hook protein [Jeotgalibacillus soli]